MRAGFLFPRWAPGTTVTLVVPTTASASVQIPNTAAGTRAKFVMVNVEPGGTATAILGGLANATQSAVSGSAGISRLALESMPLILNTAGFTHLAFFGFGGTATLRITPLETY